ncbi:monooxygenase FAD-binding protein [Epithele typhae]|uniref:monooxygenase FAD-binding protein n=1 Tax=Epithele typhae TaxID=378194 RepID=UPI002007D3E0|nr:monooxygenase FAD-binding protein [Epithele typhae]KAH9917131.1 monooxygenase FAD-binding protein [Epithele typhae]
MATTTSSPRIAIIGAGPSGLVLHLTLVKRGVPSTLYEREASPNARIHLGGTLDLRWAYGQRALYENGLEAAFKAVSRPEGDETRICGKDGRVLLELIGDRDIINPEDISPEVDRRALRQIILDAVPADSVKWGHALTSVTPHGDGTHTLSFANGHTAVVDVLVGADGGTSRIRPLVSPAQRYYAGITGAELVIPPDVVDRADMADARALVGAGTTYAMEGGNVLIGQRNSDGRVRTYAWFHGPEDWPLPADPSEARAVLLEKFEGWAPVLRKLIEHGADDAIYHRPLYMLEPGLRWEHVDGVTIIGDAAHVMTPFAGMGANVSMLDGLEMGLAIAEAVNAGASKEEREAAIKKAEEKLFEEGAKWTAVTATNMKGAIGPDAPQCMVELYKLMKGIP